MKKILLSLTIMTLLASCAGRRVEITVTNSLHIDRLNETVEIPCDEIRRQLGESTYVVTDAAGNEIPSQMIYEGATLPQKLIFQATVRPDASAVYYVKKGLPEDYTKNTYGRFAPERYDDYIWENDRIAFRIYGEALIAKDGPSNGIDAIMKRTGAMFLDKIYNDYFEKKQSYHIDHGEGVDCYNVKRSLGAGAMAPYAGGQLWLGENFTGHRTLDNGPLRTSFRLTYDTLLVNGLPLLETRIFSLDAGSQLNKITVIFDGAPEAMPVAAGIVLKKDGLPAEVADADPNHQPVLLPEKRYVAYSEQGDRAKPQYDNGIVYTAVVFPYPLQHATLAERHVLALSAYTPGGITYYAGAGWSKWGFDTPESWTDYVETFSRKLQNPLQITISR
ncbi:MAG: DUF4861 domain-containing protein [Prevotellaceae bacterium]|jgi:hypothetical protein|nr:DUF4861 domain-containing protein [Prevotellaceae bacterium]